MQSRTRSVETSLRQTVGVAALPAARPLATKLYFLELIFKTQQKWIHCAHLWPAICNGPAIASSASAARLREGRERGVLNSFTSTTNTFTVHVHSRYMNPKVRTPYCSIECKCEPKLNGRHRVVGLRNWSLQIINTRRSSWLDHRK